jgi:L-alanine-DL-glutamate epimerase-like enolase superfamily enzyme
MNCGRYDDKTHNRLHYRNPSIEKSFLKWELPWPIYKIKLKTRRHRHCKETSKTSDAIFRIDANGSWRNHQECYFIKKLGMRFLEQPWKRISGKDTKGISICLAYHSRWSCIIEEDVARCNHFSWRQYQTSKMGWINSGRRMIQQAALGMKTMVGCMTGSSVGICDSTLTSRWIT